MRSRSLAIFRRREDLAQIARHRLAQREEPDREVVEIALQLVDLGIAFDDAGGKLAVALDDRVDRRGELALGEPAHLGDRVAELAQLFVVAFDNVLGRHRSIPPRPSAQPNRPVM